ncbi:MAG: class I mannose-6-phosphate isomerase [Saprospiraceae bacterium]|nr:class I mannose-6-phosphate isomerase [Saprospiraceae bacterium]
MTFNKYPAVKLSDELPCHVGWPAILQRISSAMEARHVRLAVFECYQGVDEDWIEQALTAHFGQVTFIRSTEAFLSESCILELTRDDATDDRIFGRMTQLTMTDFLNADHVAEIQRQLKKWQGLVVVVGPGASLVAGPLPGVRIYCDLARWEIQGRMRRQAVAGLGLSNANDPIETLYKRGYFIDWRVCDALKRAGIEEWDFWLDANREDAPKMISAQTFDAALDQAVSRPFSVVPFFDPGPWGGEWMRERFQLDHEAANYAWCFNCVPEENSLLFDFSGNLFEMPSINVVFFRPDELLGQRIRSRFGEEFPIRFDFLDTIRGGNLSLQVHPLKEYIQKEFGLSYTQDESYYMLDTDENARVYLGFKTNADPVAMEAELRQAQHSGTFDAEKYVESWPAKKHDHFLIPAGTIHCSGKGCMVLEISATPYIFTFKLWDWGRLGLDGKPRPINIDRGMEVMQWDRNRDWTSSNLINRIQVLRECSQYTEESTGLHDLEFIETRRHWQTGPVTHDTEGNLCVMMLIEGEEAIIESPDHAFTPSVVHYAEAFILPAQIGKFTVRPHGNSDGKKIATIKAYVR